MNRAYLIEHLEDQGCHPDYILHEEVGEMWNNCINGETCLVPFEDELSITTWCHIIFELRVAPPIEFDSDYYVYEAWRQKQLNTVINKK